MSRRWAADCNSLDKAFTPHTDQKFVHTDIGTDNPVRFIRVKPDAAYPFQQQLFAELLADFVASRNSTKHFPVNFLLRDDDKRAFGLESIRNFAESLNCVNKGDLKLDRRNSFFLREYMELMRSRFCYLHNRGEIQLDEHELEYLDKICAEMQKSLAMILKYQIRKDPALLVRARDLYLSCADGCRSAFQVIADRMQLNC